MAKNKSFLLHLLHKVLTANLLKFSFLLFVLFGIKAIQAQDSIRVLFIHSFELETTNEKIKLRSDLAKQYPDNQYGMLCKGWLQAQDGDIDLASTTYNKVIRLFPQFDYAYYFKGNLFLDKFKKFDYAIQEYKTAIQIDPENSLFYWGLGDAYYETGNYINSIQSYDRSFKLYQEPFVLYQRAKTKFVIGDFIGSMNDCNVLISIDSSDANYFFLRGMNFLELNKYDSAVTDYSKAIILNPNFGNLFRFRAEAYYELGSFDLLKKDCEIFLKYDKDYVCPCVDSVDYAIHKVQKNEYQVAMRYFGNNEPKLKNPKKLQYYQSRAKAKKETGDRLGAIADYSKAISIAKDDEGEMAMLLAEKAFTQYESGKYSEAYSDFTIYTKSNKTRITNEQRLSNYFYFAKTCIALGLFGEAYKELTQACEMVTFRCSKPDYKTVNFDSTCLVVMGDLCLQNTGKYSEAISKYSLLITLYPDDLSLYKKRALAYEKNGEISLANSDIFFPLLHEARRLSKSDSIQTALSFYDKYIKSISTNAEAFEERAKIHELTQNLKAAIIDIDAAIALQPENIPFREYKLKLLKSEGNYFACAEELINIRNLSKENDKEKINSDIADMLIKAGDYNQALKILTNLEKKQQSNYYTQKRIGLCHLKLGNFNLASDVLNEVLIAEKGKQFSQIKFDDEFYYFLALAEYGKKNLIPSLENLNTAMSIFSKPEYTILFSTWTEEYLTSTGINQGSSANEIVMQKIQERKIQKEKIEKSQINNYYKKLSFATVQGLSTNYSFNIQNLNKLSTEYPFQFETYYWLSFYYSKLEDYNAAISNIHKAISLNKSIIKDSLYYLKGRLLMWLNKPGEAIASLDTAIAQNKRNFDYYYHRGIAYEEVENFEMALKDLNMAIAVNPGNPKAYAEIAFCYTLQNQYDKAIDYISETLTSFPQNTTLLLMRGLIYSNENQYEKAISDINTVINTHEISQQDYIEAVYQRGRCYFSLGYYKDAISDFSLVLKMKKHYKAFYYRGISYYYLDNEKSALSDFDMCISLKENDPKPHCYIGRILIERNNYSSAIECFNNAIKIDKSYADAYYYRGIAKHNQNVNSIVGRQDYCREACNDWHTARSYGHKQAGSMINKYCR